MGGCTSDTYRILKKQHGQIFQHYIVNIQSIKQLKKIIQAKQIQYDTKVENKRAFFHNEVNLRQADMKKNFQQIKISLDEELPGGIESLQQMKGDFIQNLLGYQEYIKRFKSVHNQIDRQIDQQRQKTHKQFEQIIQQAKSQQKQIDPEKIIIYHEATQQKRQQIHEKGAKQFSQLIKARLQHILTKNQKKLDLNQQLERYNTIVSLEHVDHLVSISRNKFRAQALAIAGGSFDSNIKI